jgi:hypothetical protein
MDRAEWGDTVMALEIEDEVAALRIPNIVRMLVAESREFFGNF